MQLDLLAAAGLDREHVAVVDVGVVVVEVGADRYEAVAAPLEGDERERAFTEQAERNPVFAEYQEKTDRVIPVVALTRSE